MTRQLAIPWHGTRARALTLLVLLVVGSTKHVLHLGEHVGRLGSLLFRTRGG